MSKVKMFDFQRFALVSKDPDEPVLVNPIDIIAVTRLSVGITQITIDGGVVLDSDLMVQELEDEINRALEATLQAQKDLHSETTGKLEGLIAELKSKLEPTAEDFFKNNDLYPKGEN